MMKNEVEILTEIARLIRIDVVTMIHMAGDGHPGPSLSCADIIAALYFNVMRVDPANPNWPERDRFILSKGHACPALYAALARRGYFPHAELPKLRSLGSILQGHPDINKTPGIDMTSGSLGNGISIGIGMALAGRLKGQKYFTYVLTGDGELQEGIVWEALMMAKKYRLGRLIVFVDNNEMQSSGYVKEVSSLYPILPKFEAFGWHCQEIDGHNIGEILDAVKAAHDVTDRPSMILAHTVKGKGVPYMIGNNSWHKRVPTKDELNLALAVLGGDD
ncbi:MAG TPA: transketolase [Clostridiaceae bacterium]|nr:transketolase [Clostridiaceae bacterium]